LAAHSSHGIERDLLLLFSSFQSRELVGTRVPYIHTTSDEQVAASFQLNNNNKKKGKVTVVVAPLPQSHRRRRRPDSNAATLNR